MQSIAKAMVKAQKEFGPALKTATNPHFRSKYADLSACVEAVIGALNNNGIALIQNTHECADGVVVETVFLHESGETLSTGKLHVPASKKDAQGYGSAMTYARRYSLMAACGIAPEDDDGNAAARSNKVADAIIKADVKPMAGAGQDLTQEQADKVSQVASKVLDWINSGSIEDAVAEKENAALNTEETLYFWTFFDSKQKTAMKNEFSKQKTARLNKAA